MPYPWYFTNCYARKIDPMSADVMNGKIAPHTFEVMMKNHRGEDRRVALCAYETDAQTIADSLNITCKDERN